jgi:uncharacterized protein
MRMQNIDHRRVPNLMVFFRRNGDGDLVTWALGGNSPPIGIVVDQKARWSGRHMIVHTSGRGQRCKMCCWIGRSRDITDTSALRG